MSFVSRFKARKELEPFVNIECGDVTFKVERWSAREFNELLLASNAKAQQAGLKTAIAGISEYTIFAVLDLLKRHIIDWTHSPKEGEEKLEFSKDLISPLLDSLTAGESAELFTKVVTLEAAEITGKK